MKPRFKTLSIWGLVLIASLLVIGMAGICTAQPDAAWAFAGIPALPLALGGTKLFGEKIYDWEKIHDVPEADRRDAIIARANEFMKEIAKRDLHIAPIGGEKMTGVDANLMGQIPVVLVMSDTIKTPDRGYELLFDEVDMRQSGSNTFELLDVSGGVTFYQQLAGEEAKLSKIPTSAKTQVALIRYIGGFPILDDWLRFNQFYKIDQLTADTMRRWYTQKATIMYGLLTALSSGINESFATDDVTTINNACTSILTNLEAAGYSVDENEQFVITCNPSLRARIFKAIASTFINPNTNNNQIVHNISAVVSTTKLVNTSYYVSLPGRKNQRGEWEDLNARPPQRNELKLGADHVWTGAYNAIIGEAKQHRRCALS